MNGINDAKKAFVFGLEFEIASGLMQTPSTKHNAMLSGDRIDTGAEQWHSNDISTGE